MSMNIARTSFFPGLVLKFISPVFGESVMACIVLDLLDRYLTDTSNTTSQLCNLI